MASSRFLIHGDPGASRFDCTRCGGLMVQEHCTDLLDNTGQLDFGARRCVQCGEVVDPVILYNRKSRPGVASGSGSNWSRRRLPAARLTDAL
jgi:hypothetical protein